MSRRGYLMRTDSEAPLHLQSFLSGDVYVLYTFICNGKSLGTYILPRDFYSTCRLLLRSPSGVFNYLQFKQLMILTTSLFMSITLGLITCWLPQTTELTKASYL